MFVGHFGLGMAGKRAVPRISLGTFFLAVQWADLVWPLLTLLGIEHVRIAPGITRATPLDFYDIPWSHSLVALMAWGVAFGLVHWARNRDRAAAVVLFCGVVSHWFLDAAMHRPEMPIFPRGPYIGLGLWNSIPATLAVEGSLYAVGIVLYARATRPVNRRGVWSLWLLLGMLAALWVGAMFAPPPPDVRAVAVSGAVLGWLVVLPWGYWIDRNRVPRIRNVILRDPEASSVVRAVR
jgi:membrane-bound metal-dependent hydrolase YbcI (DUF457 family)